MSEVILFIKFRDATVTYNDEYKLEVFGTLYPRHWNTINQMIQLFKEETREDKKEQKP
jgi:hypothetical protein